MMDDKNFRVPFDDEMLLIDGIGFKNEANYFAAKNALLSSMYEGFDPSHEYIIELQRHVESVDK
ncbi:hypothetical protein RD055328_01370 [Companilactobacillus sp. RD055328]|uniref:hypothetical protein n=1 Tax=Companilactobacillus sp. RD055328 TaxID=2916634 RepID=UPI001FC7FDD1|nr:hypothetical protein [Companilactobacillus sp. RD055328]GKQ42214.1 hypothetical protein RD055328_01370 [Companilactobacillus sp. RD055328]